MSGEYYDSVLLGRLCEKMVNTCRTAGTFLYAINTQLLGLFDS
jgi:hypothetical protein